MSIIKKKNVKKTIFILLITVKHRYLTIKRSTAVNITGDVKLTDKFQLLIFQREK